MTLEEAKELETKIANDILNNIPLSAIVQLASQEAQNRAKKIIADSTQEQLSEMKEKFEEAEKAAAESAEAEVANIKSEA